MLYIKTMQYRDTLVEILAEDENVSQSCQYNQTVMALIAHCPYATVPMPLDGLAGGRVINLSTNLRYVPNSD